MFIGATHFLSFYLQVGFKLFVGQGDDITKPFCVTRSPRSQSRYADRTSARFMTSAPIPLPLPNGDPHPHHFRRPTATLGGIAESGTGLTVWCDDDDCPLSLSMAIAIGDLRD